MPLRIVFRALLQAAFVFCGVATIAGAGGRAAAQCIPFTQLIASDHQTRDFFGQSIAISGDTAVVGARAHMDPATASEGAIYVFVRAGSTWVQQAKLVVPNDPYGLGETVAINGNTILSNNGDTSAYIFTRSGAAWTLQGTLPSVPLGSGGDQFTSVKLGSIGTRLVAVVGAEFATVNGLSHAGAVHVFTINPIQVGSVWTEVARLTAPDAAANDYFGDAISFAGTTLVIGAQYKSNAGGTLAGAAYVFTSNNIGSGWTFQARLFPPVATPTTYLYFGQGVSVSQDTAVVNAYYPVASYVFTRTGSAWTLQQTIPQPGNSITGTVRIIGDVLVTGLGNIYGHDAGRANLLERPPDSGITGAWTHRAVLRATGAPSFDDVGTGVDFSGTSVLMSVLGDSGNPATSFLESAYILDITAVCSPDFDCNGSLAIADIFAFLNAWFAGSATADFDGDTYLAVADIFAFLNAWFAGC